MKHPQRSPITLTTITAMTIPVMAPPDSLVPSSAKEVTVGTAIPVSDFAKWGMVHELEVLDMMGLLVDNVEVVLVLAVV